MLNINPSKLLKTVSVLLLGYTLQAGAGITTSATSRHLHYIVPMNKSLVVNLDRIITQITVGNPEIAIFTFMPPNTPSKQLLLRGMKEGKTNATLWDSDAHVAMVVDVEVVEEQVQSQNLRDLKKLLYQVMPEEEIEILPAGNCILLKGEVSNIVKMDYAMKIAQGFATPPGKGGYASATGAGPSPGERSTQINVNSGVGSNGFAGSNGGAGCGDRTGGSGGGGGNTSQSIINMMHVGGEQQVMLEVKIAEVSRSLARLLRLDTGANKTSQTSGSFIWSALAGAAGAFSGAYVAGDTLFHWSLDFSRNTDLATILAEPNLTTLSGKKASFRSGGEFPYTACTAGTGSTGIVPCTVNFKPFGVSLEFTPVVLDSNRINLTTRVEVSSLSNKANEVVAAGLESTSLIGNDPITLNLQPVPSLDSREAFNTLELADGQTMSIAGLISENNTAKQEQTPGLADIPLIGSLFRNREARNEKKELVILITPHLAKPIPHDQIKLPTDNYVAPDDIEFYLLGRMEARQKQVNTAQAPVFDPMSGGTTGQFGHQINDGDSQ